MGREFLGLFEQWAESYDRSVEGEMSNTAMCLPVMIAF